MTMVKRALKHWEKLYLSLALHIDSHLYSYYKGKGQNVRFVEAYYGPSEIKELVDRQGILPLSQLNRIAKELIEAIKKENLEEPRKNILLKNIESMKVLIEKLGGKSIEYMDEVKIYYDIIPYKMEEKQLERALSIYNELTGDRLEERRERLKIPIDKLKEISHLTLEEVRRRSKKFIPFPLGEMLTLSFIKNQPWYAYNWYEGNYQSRVELNLEKTHFLTSHVVLMAHEGYPGHHTEHCLKEQLFFREKGYIEYSIILNRIPENTISEGLAEIAHKVIFKDLNMYEWIAENLAKSLRIELDPQLEIKLDEAKNILRYTIGNSAYLLYKEGWPKEQVIDYFAKYNQTTYQEAEKSLEFAFNSYWAPFVYNYTIGRKLVEEYVGTPPSQKKFIELINSQMLPSHMSNNLKYPS
jgi:hypothetical protein